MSSAESLPRGNDALFRPRRSAGEPSSDDGAGAELRSPMRTSSCAAATLGSFRRARGERFFRLAAVSADFDRCVVGIATATPPTLRRICGEVGSAPESSLNTPLARLCLEGADDAPGALNCVVPGRSTSDMPLSKSLNDDREASPVSLSERLVMDGRLMVGRSVRRIRPAADVVTGTSLVVAVFVFFLICFAAARQTSTHSDAFRPATSSKSREPSARSASLRS
mmetsp:Transcript_16856/g.43841  ORF Transcript_16856/g.43841 Transcript_16856/m.43841 type:complete len:224 (+) Transcript_16856:1483-2154(+)